MIYTFLLVVHAIIAAALVGVILVQRSEGGGLGVGGSPSGLMSARGAADFLTRSTAILAGLFVLMSIGLAALATVERRPTEIDTSLARRPAPTAPANNVPLADPLAGAGAPVAAPAAEGTPPAPVAVTKLPELPAASTKSERTSDDSGTKSSDRDQTRTRSRDNSATRSNDDSSERPRRRRDSSSSSGSNTSSSSSSSSSSSDRNSSSGSSSSASAPKASAPEPSPAPSNAPAANDTPPPSAQ